MQVATSSCPMRHRTSTGPPPARPFLFLELEGFSKTAFRLDPRTIQNHPEPTLGWDFPRHLLEDTWAGCKGSGQKGLDAVIWCRICWTCPNFSKKMFPVSFRSRQYLEKPYSSPQKIGLDLQSWDFFPRTFLGSYSIPVAPSPLEVSTMIGDICQQQPVDGYWMESNGKHTVKGGLNLIIVLVHDATTKLFIFKLHQLPGHTIS